MTSHLGTNGKALAPAGSPRNGPSVSEEQANRVSKWIAAVYVAVALATPVLVYSGPDVMTPTAPAIAEAALDGHLTMNAYLIHANAAAAADVH
ncbi:MAG TPA: hypothetical protein VF059_13990 [Casimicrobiaceae bacterium]